MKKKLLLATLFAFTLALCACSSTRSGKVEDLENTGKDLLTIGDEETGDDATEDYYTDDEDEAIQHDEPFYPSSFDGIAYNSSVIKLGNYEGLKYSLPQATEPTEQEIQDEVNELLEAYELTELNEEALQYMGYNSVEELYAEVKTNIFEGLESQYYSDATTALYEQIMANSNFNIDTTEIDSIYEEQLASYEEYASFFGMSLEEMCTDYFEMSLEELQEELKDDSEYSLKISLLVEAIIKDADIDVEALWDESSAKLLADYGFEDAWEYIDLYESETSLISEVKYMIITNYLMEKGVNTAE